MSVRGLHVACSVSLCLAAASRFACGQETGSARWRIVGAWLALGPNASFLTRMGSRHHDVYVLGVRVERPLARSGGVELYHTVDAVPLAVSTATPLEYDERSCHSRPAPSDTIVPLCARQVARMGSVYGFGLSPAGLELRYVPHHRGVQVVAGAAVGALFFTRPMPDPLASRLNFSLAGDVGVRLAVGGARAFEVRYRFQHISNADLGRVNPGVNAHMLRVGLAVR